MSEPAAPPETLPAPSPAADVGRIDEKPLQRRLIAALEVLLCSTVPTQVLILLVLTSAGWQLLGPDGQYSLPFVVTLALADTVVLIALMVAITWAHGQSLGALWLGRRPVLGEVIYGVLLVPVVFLMVVVLLNVLRMMAPWLHNVPENPLEQLARGGPFDALVFGLVAIVAGGVREELQRAFLLKRFEDHLGGAVVGVTLLAVAFGLGHYDQGWDAVITTGTLGLFWSIVYLRRRSSVAPIVSHAGFNSLEILRVAALGG